MYKVKVNNKNVYEINDSSGIKSIDQQDFKWDVINVEENYFHIIIDNHSFRAEVTNIDFGKKEFQIKVNGVKHEVNIKDKFDFLLEKLGINNSNASSVKEIKAPMPGLIATIFVEEGASIKKGDPLLILEAMKMENMLKSPGEGVVKEIKVRTGQSVEKNQVLIQF